MTINDLENGSCSMQFAKMMCSPPCSGDNTSESLDMTINVMHAHGLPIVLVDNTREMGDSWIEWGSTAVRGGYPLIAK